MALKAQLNDGSFNIFLTQKTNLGEKAINLMSLSGNFFFVRGARHGPSLS